jgi:phage tail-like protein
MALYPNVNFHFQVSFDIPNKKDIDIGFQSVTGLDNSLQTENINEGGVNLYSHAVPTRKKAGPLVLKRGLLAPGQSSLTDYLISCFRDEVIAPMSHVLVQLLNDQHKPMLQWTATNAWPLSWKLGELNAMQGEVLIETLELNYNQLFFDKLP